MIQLFNKPFNKRLTVILVFICIFMIGSFPEQLNAALVSSIETIPFKEKKREKEKGDEYCPILIHSDRGDFDHKTGNATHHGHVVVNQGKRQLKADTVVIHRNTQGQIDKMEAFGKPAHFHAQLEMEKPPLVGKAEIMQYYPKESKIVLLKNAELKQNEQAVQGPLIRYFLNTRELSSESQAGSRTTLIFQSKDE